MSRRRLNEDVDDYSLMWGSIEKAKAHAPLSPADVNHLLRADFGTLVTEFGLTYNEASNVLYWLKNEVYRLNAQSVTYGKLEDYEARGRRPGSPGLLESKSRNSLKDRIRKSVNESKRNMSRQAKDHFLNGHSSNMAKCWGHGDVVDPAGYTQLIQMGIDFTSGKSRSPIPMTEGQLRRKIRQAIKASLKVTR